MDYELLDLLDKAIDDDINADLELLMTEGVLTADGQINRDKINLMSGAFVSPLVDAIILCPQYQPLAYCTTNRDGYREYKSKPYRCKDCPTRAQCTLSRNYQKTVTCHIWHDYLEQAEDIRHSPLGRETYS